jgi:hypothetical protein
MLFYKTIETRTLELLNQLMRVEEFGQMHFTGIAVNTSYNRKTTIQNPNFKMTTINWNSSNFDNITLVKVPTLY